MSQTWCQNPRGDPLASLPVQGDCRRVTKILALQTGPTVLAAAEYGECPSRGQVPVGGMVVEAEYAVARPVRAPAAVERREDAERYAVEDTVDELKVRA